MTLHRPLIPTVALAGIFVIGACDDGNEATQPIAFRVHIENVASFTHVKSGVFNTPLGAQDPGPLAPGAAYEFTFTAGPNHRLAFATMFGQSNDWFFAPRDGSLALYDGDTPISGDVTDQIGLYDSGTEVDEEPAVGAHTGPNQASSVDGLGAADPDNTVREVPAPAILTSGASFVRPAVAEMIEVTITSNAATREFTVRIENVSEDGVTLMTSEGGKPVRVSPGVWAIGGENILFTAGQPDRGEGLEDIAEGGNVAALSSTLEATAGVATPISPGLYVLHTSGNPLFASGQPDRGLGLELIAERGDPSALANSFDTQLPDNASTYGVFNTPTGATDPGPIRPGDAYNLDIEALPGDRLSFATMYGASNDWIFATSAEGIALFDDDNMPRTGDVTDSLAIWDVGTELSEEPAIGPNIGGPEGPLDPNTNVRMVDGTYSVPANQHLRVTISLP